MKGVHGLKGDKTRKLPKKFRSNVGPAQPASGQRHERFTKSMLPTSKKAGGGRRAGPNGVQADYYMADIKTQTVRVAELVDAANGAAMTDAVKRGLNPMHIPLLDKEQTIRKMIARVARFYGVHGKYASATTQMWLAGVKPKAK